ncbi:DUF1330 domain-containing protein [Gimibacter soli]|uniref:DUF1330 domain-containing protein n=1 Tax=Gimibacter soli TaxID=3024400 RepID=A0AAF0BMB2_9PROT|nr:DUF1330 domain-containing protein [Gimibacter soli]WCL54286.1 DUF1330 domain-containing protein [Gimibacter soli]
MAEDRYIDPDREAFEAFKALPRDTPIHMLNLIRYRAEAAYPAGHALAGKGLTGAEAYAEYGKASGPIFTRLGGSILWRGRFEGMVIGPDDKQWDNVFIAQYPNAGAFLAMVTDPDYRLAVVHRQAAVLTSRLMRFTPDTSGDMF